jgi:hypothetical protein
MGDKMGIRFAAVPKSHVAATPNFIGAAGLDQRQRQQAEALRTDQIGEAVGLYQNSTGEKSPIYDYLFPDSEAAESGNVYDGVTGPEGLDGVTGEIVAEPAIPSYVDVDPMSLEPLTSLTPESASAVIDPMSGEVMSAVSDQLLRQQAEEMAIAGLAETAVTDVAADAALNAGAENVLGSAIAGGGGNPYITALLAAKNFGVFG